MKIIKILILISYGINTFSQEDRLCKLDLYLIGLDDNKIDLSFKNTKEAYKYIESMLKKVGLPMNFHVNECAEIKCKYPNNAYARLDSDGTRFIIYDNSWFSKLDIDSTKIKSQTILAHEIGHHLAAHTLSLNYQEYYEAYKYCYSKNKSYDKLTCDSLYIDEYKMYLKNSRKQELQADRFAGYIMHKMGFSLSEIQSVYYRITNNNDDSNSTHPKLSKRLKAIKEGVDLALSKNKATLLEIKGNKVDFIIKDSTIINKNRLIENIKNSVTAPCAYLFSKSDKTVQCTSNSLPIPDKIKEGVRKYLKQDEFIYRRDENNEYFEFFELGIGNRYNKRYFYQPYPAMHIFEGELILLLFESGKPRVVYKSIFDQDAVSLEEIKTLFIEIYSTGLQRVIFSIEN